MNSCIRYRVLIVNRYTRAVNAVIGEGLVLKEANRVAKGAEGFVVFSNEKVVIHLDYSRMYTVVVLLTGLFVLITMLKGR